ncbi:phospholipid-binding protein MlaC [Nevskia sp.]|uniref:MlaC/ttg2D family ABC transporter substrate-binding protein n=1 Tax=Nevskia sp. TaxID=1929292 RepID=UPI0025CBE7F1|nr:ABC transporter substrate-binding protein [Nevskia sp.]
MSLILTLGFAAGAQAAATTPDQALRGTTEQIQKLIKDNYKTYRADLPTFYKAVDDVVVPRFDVPYITQLVLATHYKAASPEQRTRFAAAFKNMLVRAYGNAMLDNYASIQIEWLPVRVDGDKALVNTSMSSGAGQKYAIGFRVRKVNDDWKVFDIAVENISLITNFRTQLSAEIKKTSLDDVIRRMETDDFTKAAPGAN